MSISNKIQVQEYVWDFAVDGGAVGAFNLHAKDNKAVIPVGAIVKRVLAKVLTTCTSGGSATLIWGNGSDTDGFSGTAIAVASLTANAVFCGNEDHSTPGALLFSSIGTTPATVVDKAGLVVTSAAAGQFVATVGTAALTAGKIVFVVEYFLPEAVA